ncbi:hypothetical protein ACTFIZ_003861 [Dictyostelium cf. discoideum]
MNEEQENEILAISSIYPDNFSEIETIIGEEEENDDDFDYQDNDNQYSKIYQVIITPNISCLDENSLEDNNNNNNNNGLIIDTSYDYFIYFKFKYTKEYPSNEPPIISIKATWLQKSDQSILLSHLEDLWNQNELVIFQMISWLQEESIQILNNHYKSIKKFSHYHLKKSLNSQQLNQNQNQIENQNQNQNQNQNKEKVPTIYTGQSVTEKKSKFQAHLAIVHSEREVQLVLNQLLSFKKIYEATHNMYAYRFQLENGEINEYYNDDGEDGAGDKMLFTLSKNQTKEILIICTRWFGGILLGGRRYVHIVNTTKDILNLYNTNSLSQCSLEFN